MERVIPSIGFIPQTAMMGTGPGQAKELDSIQVFQVDGQGPSSWAISGLPGALARNWNGGGVARTQTSSSVWNLMPQVLA